jgi:hypothetical protein
MLKTWLIKMQKKGHELDVKTSKLDYALQNHQTTKNKSFLLPHVDLTDPSSFQSVFKP